MIVLVLCSVPDPKEHGLWHDMSDLVAIREALRGLCVATAATRAHLVLAPHPAVTPLVSALLPAQQFSLVENLADPDLLSEVERAVLIGGMDAELTLARAVREQGKKVWPIASTGGAAHFYLDERAEGANAEDFSPLTPRTLIQDTVYAPLLERILSL